MGEWVWRLVFYEATSGVGYVGWAGTGVVRRAPPLRFRFRRPRHTRSPARCWHTSYILVTILVYLGDRESGRISINDHVRTAPVSW